MKETENIISLWRTCSGNIGCLVKRDDRFRIISDKGGNFWPINACQQDVENDLRSWGYTKLPGVPEKIVTMSKEQLLKELNMKIKYRIGKVEVYAMVNSWGEHQFRGHVKRTNEMGHFLTVPCNTKEQAKHLLRLLLDDLGAVESERSWHWELNGYLVRAIFPCSVYNVPFKEIIATPTDPHKWLETYATKVYDDETEE